MTSNADLGLACKVGAKTNRVLVATVLCLLCLNPSWADFRTECSHGADRDRRISACTEVIARGKLESPNNRANAYINRGSVLLAKREVEGAIADFTDAIALNPTSGIAFALRGLAHERVGNKRQALADFEKALQIDPSSKYAKAGLDRLKGGSQAGGAKGYADCNQHEDVDRQIKGCTQIIARKQATEKSRANAYIARGSALMLKRNYDRAIADFTDAIALNPTSSIALREAFEQRGLANELAGNKRQALADYQKALQIDPSEETAKSALDRLNCNQHEDVDRRIKGCTRIIARKQATRNSRANAYINRGHALLLKRTYDRAIADFTDAIALNPASSIAFEQRGLANERAGNKREAVADYQKALQTDPSTDLAKRRLDGLYKQTFGHCFDNQDAIHSCTQLIEGWPNTRPWDRHVAHRRRGAAYAAQGKIDAAIADYDKAIALDSKVAITYVLRANAYCKKDQTDKAIGDYTRAIKLDQKLVVAYLNRGLVYYKKGAIEPALTDFRKALEIDPSNRLAKRYLAVAKVRGTLLED